MTNATAALPAARRRLLLIGGSADSPWLEGGRRGLGALVLAHISAAPWVVHLGTASGDAEDTEVDVEQEFGVLGADVTHLRLFRRDMNREQIQDVLARANVVYISGGNTANALAVWRTHGVDKLLRATANTGTLFVGKSAGAIAMMQGGLTDSYGDLELISNGLGLSRGFVCPHYNDPRRQRAFEEQVRHCESRHPTSYGIPDGVALYFHDGLRAAYAAPEAAPPVELRRAGQKVLMRELAATPATSVVGASMAISHAI